MAYADTIRTATADLNDVATLIEGIFSSTYGLTFTTWTPTLTTGSGTIGTTTIDYAKYIQCGKLVIAIIQAHGTTTGTPTDVRASLPVAAASVGNVFGAGWMIPDGSNDYSANIEGTGSSLAKWRRASDNSGYTAGAGRYIAGVIIYEAS